MSGSKDKTIRVWDLNQKKEILKLTGHTDSINAVAISIDGTLIVSGSNDKTVRI